MHLADAFIQSDFRLYIYYQYMFPGNRTHNLCAANTTLYHWATGTLNDWTVKSAEKVLKPTGSVSVLSFSRNWTTQYAS